MLCRQELEDAEFIPIPPNSQPTTPDQLPSYSDSFTLPYEELQGLKFAAVSAKKDLPVR